MSSTTTTTTTTTASTMSSSPPNSTPQSSLNNSNKSLHSTGDGSNTALSKSVKFDQVFIHEFPIIMGDNPAVSKGAPLTIGWKSSGHDVVDVDIYEYLRGPERRHRKRIIISTNRRAKILMNAGYSIDDIAEMTLQVEKDKQIRAANALEATTVGTNTPLSALKALNSNILDLLSGAAEGTGRTLFLAPNAMLGAANVMGKGVGKVGKGVGKAGKGVVTGTGKVVVGTGKVATDVVMGTGRLGYDVVLGTGKVATDVVVGTGKVATDVVFGTVKGTGKVVVGTGKLGYGAVKSTGRRVSKMIGLGESKSILEFVESEDDDDNDYGYGDARPSSAVDDNSGNEAPQRRFFGGGRRASNGSHSPAPRSTSDSDSRRASAQPAPQRMQRRGSNNGGPAAIAPQQLQEQKKQMKRRGSGNRAIAGSFSNFKHSMGFGGSSKHKVERSESSKGKLQGRSKSTLGGYTGGGSKHTMEVNEGGRRRASMAAPLRSPPQHSKSDTEASRMGESCSDLHQMEQFVNVIQSDPLALKTMMGDCSFDDSTDELDFNHPDGSNGSHGSGAAAESPWPDPTYSQQQ